MLEINGQEGGGQLLRTALALSLCTGEPFRMEHIHAKRSRPGLMRQHLTAVQAAQEVGNARVIGDAPGSTTLEFAPGPIRGGDYHWPIGTAGSTTLVAQTVLPALWMAGVPARLRLEGGTHNPLAPSADFLAHSFLPLRLSVLISPINCFFRSRSRAREASPRRPHRSRTQQCSADREVLTCGDWLRAARPGLLAGLRQPLIQRRRVASNSASSTSILHARPGPIATKWSS